MKSRLRSFAVAVAVAVVGLAFGVALPAAAHAGEILLSLTPDGAGGVSLTATYEADAHAVNEIIDPVLTATSSSGATVGPVHLVSSPEGQGVWITEKPVLDEGLWSVTVTISTPSAATITSDIAVVPLDAPVEAATGMPTVESESVPSELTSVLPLVLGIAGIVLIALATTALVAHRIRTRARRVRSRH